MIMKMNLLDQCGLAKVQQAHDTCVLLVLAPDGDVCHISP